MAYAYRFLNADDKADIDSRILEQAKSAVTHDLRRAWEQDHYAHALLAEAAADPDEKQAHLDAMATIEAALAENL